MARLNARLTGTTLLARIMGQKAADRARGDPRFATSGPAAGCMPVHFVNVREDQPLADYLARELGAFASSVRSYSSLEDVRALLSGRAPYCLVVVLHPISRAEMIDEVIAFAQDNRDHAYVAYVADDVTAVDFRRLLNTGAGEWFPKQSAPIELLNLVERLRQHPVAPRPEGHCLFTSFIPGGGGAGASTLAAETAVYFARRTQETNRGGEPRACVIDLNLQQGNVCDLFDVTPQLDMLAIAGDPGRIDDEVLTAFRSRTAYGVDVFAAPKFTEGVERIAPEAVFALCNALIDRYDYVNADLPGHIYPWTDEIIRNSDAGVITATCSVPSALRISALWRRLEGRHVHMPNLLLAVNRFPAGLLQRGLDRAAFEAALPGVPSLYIPQDDAFAAECANVGRPMMADGRRKPAVRGIVALGEALLARRAHKLGLDDAGARPASRYRLWGLGA